MNKDLAVIADIAERNADDIISRWQALLIERGISGNGRIKEGELKTQCREFLKALNRALSEGGDRTDQDPYEQVRALLAGISRSRAAQGFSPSETASFVFSLKEPLFEQLRSAHPDDAKLVADAGWQMNRVIDELGLYTMEIYQKSREDVVRRQQEEISELSTPVVKLWDGILALPLIGTLDSSRTQVVMETFFKRSSIRVPISRSSTLPAFRPSIPSSRSIC